MAYLAGEEYIIPNYKNYSTYIKILFSESYSFDQPEYYATCCRTKTYQEHVALRNYALEHTKPLFNKHSLLTLHNLYASRSLVELI